MPEKATERTQAVVIFVATIAECLLMNVSRKCCTYKAGVWLSARRGGGSKGKP